MDAHLRLTFVLMAAAVCGGCFEERIDATYGKRRGASGGRSVNGTRVLADMFELAGHRVTTWTRLSPGLEQYDVIVWFPDDFNAPTRQQRYFLEEWLAAEDGRVLIYVGRDYDAEIAYWEAVQPSAPPQQAVEFARKLAEAKARHTSRRNAMKAESFGRWFVARRDRPKRKVFHLEGPWAEGMDASKTEIVVHSRLDPPDEADHAALGTEAEAEAEFVWEVDESWKPWDDVDDELPAFSEPLLFSENDMLVYKVTDYYWQSSRIYVVANGSFLLNLPLVNHEHRKLADQLIEACGDPPKRVAFIESGPGGPEVHEVEPHTRYPTGWEALTTWPLSAILLHAAIIGILYCFARFAIFGRPRHLPETEASDFGKHIEALGKNLQRSGDVSFARNRIEHYKNLIARE